MKDAVFREALDLLKQAQLEFSRDAQGRAEELVALATDRLEQGLEDQGISPSEYLTFLTNLLAAVPPSAKLIDTLLQKLG